MFFLGLSEEEIPDSSQLTVDFLNACMEEVKDAELAQESSQTAVNCKPKASQREAYKKFMEIFNADKKRRKKDAKDARDLEAAMLGKEAEIVLEQKKLVSRDPAAQKHADQAIADFFCEHFTPSC